MLGAFGCGETAGKTPGADAPVAQAGATSASGGRESVGGRDTVEGGGATGGDEAAAECGSSGLQRFLLSWYGPKVDGVYDGPAVVERSTSVALFLAIGSGTPDDPVQRVQIYNH